ncbi:hypothetical protein POSPLADRAFT_1049601 [Postia placenta MAD-698-R-SB12]|uniref:SPIN90/Ldb17 leucine-rich domain-containing protein n=1 Tax=Postia placenta MAD-698-R-SB12 TaxID=670580 RepID=A0A1X6MPR6_9APHY|nr:hypothetical protein POSPLADRAFT_1049601 [Postia placenta MAD-698-R-SB12]OSX58404.1 hypothetical protein POSPLADRAFT_1049601 [Postia placenta MAD-698-R-SB12]
MSPMDVFGVVYIIENAQQFWSELEDILHIPDRLTLDRLDATLRRFVSFCAAYHEQYLQSPLQMEHAYDLLLASELLAFHSERMSDILLDDARNATDPHLQLILYSVLLAYGRQNMSFLRSQKRWQPLLPLLMDNVVLDVDPGVEDTYSGLVTGSSSGGQAATAVPIEAKLRSLSVRLLYEVCRVQKLSLPELEIFSDTFIDYLFELVEQTRHMQDETFNYSVIKLIVALNEQFMVASLPSHPPHVHGKPALEHKKSEKADGENRVLRVLMARQGSSMTFGENMIFMLNRADRTPEDLCMQLLVLKLLYLLFTTEGMSEYFYTNDLRVLVDVFLREIGNIDEDNESLRHTYLRVLHPLLTKTQLRTMPYKRAQVIRTLESLVENETIHDIDPTTKRLVARCLSGDWCVQFRKTLSVGAPPRVDSPSSVMSEPHGMAAYAERARSGSIRGKNYKASRSAENLLNLGHARGPSQGRHGPLDGLRQPSADSTSSLPKAATTSAPTSAVSRRRDRAGSSPTEPDSPVSLLSSSSSSTLSAKPRRTPPPPPKRRKPPAVPVARSGLSALTASQPSLTELLPKGR